jgi:hypothetical protein
MTRHSDEAIIARIIELAPDYDPETMPYEPGTLPKESGWGYSFINFAIDHLEEEFPGLTQEQFNRCYLQAYKQTDEWTTVIR